MIDEEIAEIRQIRHKISAQFDHNPRKVVAYYRNQEKRFRESGEFRFAETSANAKKKSFQTDTQSLNIT